MTTIRASHPSAAGNEKAKLSGLPNSELPITRSRARVSGRARSTAKTQLINATASPSASTRRRNNGRPAPIDRRTPISLARSKTFRAIVFANPNPPTTAVNPASDISSTTSVSNCLR